MDVFFFEAFAEEEAELRRRLPPGLNAGFTSATIQEHGAARPPAPIISIRTQSGLPAAWATELRAVLSRSTGYDHLLAWSAGMTSPPALGHLPLYCARAVAEQALLLWTALLRRLQRQVGQFARFHRDGLTGGELQGRSLVVVGVGNIGGEVARIGQGLGMRVLGVDLVRRHAFVDYAPIDAAIGQAQVLVAAMNLTERNRGYFNGELLRRAPRGAIFVNIARGELSPPSILLQLLQEGHLGGVGLDVYDQEGLLAVSLRTGQPGDHPEVRAALALKEHPDAILTPHNAFNTAEAVARKAEQTVRQLEHLQASGRFLWEVKGQAT